MDNPCLLEGALIQALALQAEELLRANWKLVETVADALNDRKRLTHAQVVQMVKGNDPSQADRKLFGIRIPRLFGKHAA
jgi:hypothetical protein